MKSSGYIYKDQITRYIGNCNKTVFDIQIYRHRWSTAVSLHDRLDTNTECNQYCCFALRHIHNTQLRKVNAFIWNILPTLLQININIHQLFYTKNHILTSFVLPFFTFMMSQLRCQLNLKCVTSFFQFFGTSTLDTCRNTGLQLKVRVKV